MNKNIKAGAEQNAGDGGYSESTKERYDAFVKVRNKSLAQSRIRELAEQAEVWNTDGDGDKCEVDLSKFAELIVRECAGLIHLECKDFANGNCFHDNALWESVTTEYGKNKERGFDPVGMSIHFDKMLKEHFGVEE